MDHRIVAGFRCLQCAHPSSSYLRSNSNIAFVFLYSKNYIIKIHVSYSWHVQILVHLLCGLVQTIHCTSHHWLWYTFRLFSNDDMLPKPALRFLFALNGGRFEIVIIRLLGPWVHVNSARRKWGYGALKDQLSCSLLLVFANRAPLSNKRVLSIGFTSSVTYHSVDPPLGLPRVATPPALPALLTWSAVGMESQFFVTMKWLPSGFPGSVAWEFSPTFWHGALEMTTFDIWQDLQSNSMWLEAPSFELRIVNTNFSTVVKSGKYSGQYFAPCPDRLLQPSFQARALFKPGKWCCKVSSYRLRTAKSSWCIPCNYLSTMSHFHWMFVVLIDSYSHRFKHIITWRIFLGGGLHYSNLESGAVR